MFLSCKYQLRTVLLNYMVRSLKKCFVIYLMYKQTSQNHTPFTALLTEAQEEDYFLMKGNRVLFIQSKGRQG